MNLDEIDALATVLLEEFGGPTQDESACEMAVRVLRELRADARRWRAVRDDLKNWKWADIGFLRRPDPDNKYADAASLDEAADRLITEQEAAS